MNEIWLYTIISVVVISLIPLVGTVILFSKKKKPYFIFGLISLAVGALFGDAFIHIIPEIIEEVNEPLVVSGYLLAGILIFFILEKFILWRHHHHIHNDKEKCEEKILPVGYISLIADGLHNFIDGAIIAGSFIVDTKLGTATAIAVVLHEIPQEIGDIGILLHAGFSKIKAVLFNLISGIFAIFGAIAVLSLAGTINAIAPLILALAAGGFIYIAGSDLVPELHKETSPKSAFIQFLAIITGIGLMFLLVLLE